MNPKAKLFQPGEIILVNVEERPAFFALIERIEPDVKKGWRRMTFVTLTLPMKRLTWILDEDQLQGQPFTMNQVPMQLQRPPFPPEEETAAPEKRRRRSSGNIVSLYGDD